MPRTALCVQKHPRSKDQQVVVASAENSGDHTGKSLQLLNRRKGACERAVNIMRLCSSFFLFVKTKLVHLNHESRRNAFNF